MPDLVEDDAAFWMIRVTMPSLLRKEYLRKLETILSFECPAAAKGYQ
jgi:hypothetical protein